MIAVQTNKSLMATKRFTANQYLLFLSLGRPLPAMMCGFLPIEHCLVDVLQIVYIYFNIFVGVILEQKFSKVV